MARDRRSFWRRYISGGMFVLLEVFCLIFVFNQDSFVASKMRNGIEQCGYPLLLLKHQLDDFFALREINTQLQEENERLRNLHQHSTLNRWSSVDSSGIDLAYVGEYDTSYTYMAAQVVNKKIYKHLNYFTLNKGSQDGVVVDMGVVHTHGVVGIVTRVSKHFSVVKPLIHSGMKLSAMIGRSDYWGVLEWDLSDGVGAAKLKDVVRNAEVELGDSIYTTSYSGVFPPYCPIGTVKKIERKSGGNFLDIDIHLFVDFTCLHRVTLVGNLYKEEQEELEIIGGF